MSDIVPQRDPWSQQDGETTADYALFSEYCKLGVRRTRRMLGAHLGISPARLSTIARANDWDARAEAYDKACHMLVPTSDGISLEDTLAYQYAVGKMMLDMGISALQLKNPASMRTADIIKLLRDGSEIQRKAAGVNDTVNITIQSNAVGKINSLLDELGVELEGEVIDEDDGDE
jgi:hypothetical protein